MSHRVTKPTNNKYSKESDQANKRFHLALKIKANYKKVLQIYSKSLVRLVDSKSNLTLRLFVRFVIRKPKLRLIVN